MNLEKFKNMDATLKALEKLAEREEKNDIKEIEEISGINLSEIESSFKEVSPNYR